MSNGHEGGRARMSIVLTGFLDELEKIAAASYSVTARPDGDGHVIEKLYVDPSQRGKGLASSAIAAIKKKYPGPLWIRPRPFGDMTLSIEDLKNFYSRHGFSVVDKKDLMLYIPKK